MSSTCTKNDNSYRINNFDEGFVCPSVIRVRIADANLVFASAICYLHARPEKVGYELTLLFPSLIRQLPKGQLISKCLFEKIVWTKKPPKNLIDSALKYCRAESIKFFSGFLVQTIFSKRHFEIN